MDFDIDDIRPTALKRLLKQALLKESRDKEGKEKSDEDADKEQEDLSELHAEKKGDAKTPKVESDDLPDDLKNAIDEDDVEDEKKGKEFPFKKGAKKPSPIKKGAKKSFPFQKKKD